MSGVEAASFVLAVLPLLISAAEHYDDCIRPVLRYRKIAAEVKLFQRQLKIQKTIFKNQCQNLLESVVEHDAARRMLGVGAEDPSWKDAILEKLLSERLGASREACITSVELIQERLQSIEAESRSLQAVVDPGQPVKHRLAKRIRFSLSESRLNEYIVSLRALNDDFTRLSNQTKDANASALRIGPSKDRGRRHINEISRYKAVREASEKVYQVLGKACTKHSEHLAHFCINPMYESTGEVSDAQIKFQIAFTRISLAHSDGLPMSNEQDEPMWFMIDTIIDPSTKIQALKDYDLNNVPCQPSGLLFQSLKRELNPTSEMPPKKPRKSVKFQTPDPSPTLSAVSIAAPFVPRWRKDFCDVLRKQLGCQSASACLGMLENSNNVKHRVYAPPSGWCRRSRQKMSLSELITSNASHGPGSSLSTYEKLHLAKVLAIAVLQYYSTPWLNMAWRSADIFFFDAEELSKGYKAMNLASPHINVRVSDECQPLRRPSSYPTVSLAPNALLFSLGVVLLELAYASTLRSLQQPCDLESGRETRYTEFFIAKRLASTTVREMGSTYSKIVKKLLQCDFGCGDDLSDPKLQDTFHSDVVCELERLEQGFRELQLG